MIGSSEFHNMHFFHQDYNYPPHTFLNHGVPGMAFQPFPQVFFPPGGGPMYPPFCFPNMPFIPPPRHGYIRPFLPSGNFEMIPPEPVPSPAHPEPGFQQPIVTEVEENDIPTRRPSVSADTQVNFSACTARFSGIGDVRTFINAILQFKNCAEISDETALRSFPLLLTDLAAIWWQSNKTNFSDWNNAIEHLRHNYRAHPQPYKVYKHLFSTHQKNASTAAFVQRAKALLDQLPPHTLTEDTQLDLVYGLLNRRIRAKINRNHFDSFAQLLELGRQAENIFEEAWSVEAMATPNSTAAPNTPLRHTADSTPTSPTYEHHSGSDVVDDPICCCERCKIFQDLLKQMCQKIPKKSAEEHVAELGAVPPEKTRKMMCFRCKSLNIIHFKCQDCSLVLTEPQKRPLLTVNIYGENFDIVVDTGARYCIASENLIKHLTANKQNFTYDYLEMSFGGDLLRQVFRIAVVDVWVTGVAVSAYFVVLPHARENVLGMDFIRNAGLVLDFREGGTWALRDVPDQIPMLYEECGEDGEET